MSVTESRPGAASADAHVRVRRASTADVDRIAPLFDAYRVFYGQRSDVEAARAFLADRFERNESVVLVGVVSGSGSRSQQEEVAGFAQLYPSFSSVSMGPIVILNDLFVTPEWRSRGVGRLLIEETARHAAREGAIRVEIATQHTNTSARRLYETLGFVADTEFVHLSLTVAAGASFA